MIAFEIFVNGKFKTVSTTESGVSRVLNRIKTELKLLDAECLMDQTLYDKGEENRFIQLKKGSKIFCIEVKSKEIRSL